MNLAIQMMDRLKVAHIAAVAVVVQRVKASHQVKSLMKTALSLSLKFAKFAKNLSVQRVSAQNVEPAIAVIAIVGAVKPANIASHIVAAEPLLLMANS